MNWWFPSKREMTTIFIVMWVFAAMSGVGCWQCCKYAYNHVHIEIK